ncbi:putative reverse transcriptase zinc-binding domain-containing protein [Helianthus annuus]|nr:putative reverse transcriptase zinc-binding domain-containing protein [Helianthus annuus]
MEECSIFLHDVISSDVKDGWIWTPDVSGKFSTSSLKDLALKDLSMENNCSYRRCGWVPTKCNIFIWRANLDRIPTRQALVRRNIMIDLEDCVLCGEAIESVDHIFTTCDISLRVWNRLSVWAKLPPILHFLLVALWSITGV